VDCIIRAPRRTSSFLRVETISPRNHLHAFRLESLADLDDEFAQWIREAHEVGEQKHLLR